MIKSIKIHT